MYADLSPPSVQHPRRYTVHVQATNECGWGPACPHVRFLTRSIESPESPWTTPEVMGGDTFILVQWHAVQVMHPLSMHPLSLHSCQCTLDVALLSLHSCRCTLVVALLSLHSCHCTLAIALLPMQSCYCNLVVFSLIPWRNVCLLLILTLCFTCFFIDLFWKLVFFFLLRCCILRTFVHQRVWWINRVSTNTGCSGAWTTTRGTTITPNFLRT